MSLNNLKQLALAAQFYGMARQDLPPASVLGKDGKTKHSWRVALLPYLEQKSLYDQYHFDEPWDSENNRKLVAKMPSLYRNPHGDPKSTNAGYFMVVGKGVIGESKTGTKFPEIKDGTGNTILFVEADRKIPWTKPEDIEIDVDATKPLPQFGFKRPDGEFGAAFADGSVRGVLETLDPKILRGLFTIAGGEVIPNEIGLPIPEPQIPAASEPPEPKVDISKLSPAQRALAYRRESANNLKWLGLAMLNVEDQTRFLPARANFDANGKPLLSWRVHLLPHLEEEALYKEFHLNEPWDSEHNKKLIDKMPAVFKDPSMKLDPGMTVYQAAVGKGLGFEGEKGFKLAQIKDGVHQTIALVEVAAENAVPWTKPADWECDLKDPAKGLADTLPNHTFQCSFFDGHVSSFKRSIDPKPLKTMLTREGGELMDLDWDPIDPDR